MRRAMIKIGTQMAGILTQDDEGYHFEYDEDPFPKSTIESDS